MDKMTEQKKAFERKDIVVEASPVPELTDDEKFNSRGNVPAVQADSPNAVIMMAMQNNYTPELIEKMMDLQAKHEAREARKAYVAAMAAFKANPPEIEKDKQVSYDTSKGKTSYSHASLANVTAKINKALSACGLSAAWQTTQDNGNVTVTCSITHAAGHSESTSLTAGPDTSGSKNSIQAMGSTISYLQRYTLLALTGLAAHDMDTDGVTSDSEPEYITEAQQKALSKDLKEIYGKDASMFFEWIGVETVDTILVSDMPKIKKGLGSAKKAKAEAAKSEREPGQEG